jgi:hypothetical protein
LLITYLMLQTQIRIKIMSVTKVTMTFYEGDEGTGEREVVISRCKEEMNVLDLMYFFADAARVAGYTYVERVGCAYAEGNETWSEY